jgi:hypothetical protein
MSNPLVSLNATIFSIGGNSFLALAKMVKLSADNTMVDGGGLADRYETSIIAKQGQKYDFTVFQYNAESIPCTNLDVSVFTVGGTSYLANMRSGSISVTTKTAEGSSIASGYKKPVPVRTQVEFTTDVLTLSESPFVATMISGTAAEMNVTVALTFGTTVFNCPMVMNAGSVTVNREETILENVTFSLAGTPTGPSDSSLLGEILLGSSAFSVSLDTGADTFATSGGQTAILTRLNTTFADGAIIEQEGTLTVQGELSAD